MKTVGLAVGSRVVVVVVLSGGEVVEVVSAGEVVAVLGVESGTVESTTTSVGSLTGGRSARSSRIVVVVAVDGTGGRSSVLLAVEVTSTAASSGALSVTCV